MFELGVENGRYYSLNVPLRDGIDDQGTALYFILLGMKSFLIVHMTVVLFLSFKFLHFTCALVPIRIHTFSYTRIVLSTTFVKRPTLI